MRRPRSLPLLRLTLRSMFAKDHPSLGTAILRTAELADHGLGPSGVVNAILDRYGNHLPADAVLELAAALERDLPLDDLGALVLSHFVVGERRLVS